MKKKKINLLFLIALLGVSFALFGTSDARNGDNAVKTSSKTSYNNRPVMQGTSAVYLIWCGNWATERPGNDGWTIGVLTDLVSNLGCSPYFRINWLCFCGLSYP